MLASALSGGRRTGRVRGSRHRIWRSLPHWRQGHWAFGLVFKLLPGLVNAMLVIGSLYIAWIGVSLLRVRPLVPPMDQIYLRCR